MKTIARRWEPFKPPVVFGSTARVTASALQCPRFIFPEGQVEWGSRATFNSVGLHSDSSFKNERLTLTAGFLERLARNFPEDPRFTGDDILELLRNEPTAAQTSFGEPHWRPESARQTFEFHLWSSVIALQFCPKVARSQPEFSEPAEDEVRKLAHDVLRGHNKEDRRAIITWAHRHIEETTRLLRTRIEATHNNSGQLGSVEFRLLIDAVLSASGVPAFVVDVENSGHLTIGVLWANADEFAPISDQPRSERVSEYEREIVRWLLAIARRTFAASDLCTSVTVLAIDDTEDLSRANVLARAQLSKSDHTRIDELCQDGSLPVAMGDWHQVLQSLSRDGVLPKREFHRFLKAFGPGLENNERAIFSSFGGKVEINSIDDKFALLPIEPLGSTIDAADLKNLRYLDREPVTAPLFSGLFWFDTYIRARTYRTALVDQKQQALSQRQQQSVPRNLNHQPVSSERPRIRVQKN